MYFPKKQYHQPKTRLSVLNSPLAAPQFAYPNLRRARICAHLTFVSRNTGMQARMMERKPVLGHGEAYTYGQFHQKSE
ncbi:hypothetical protein KHP57_21285, partial [Algiphilus sp. NNCM1]|nr:hypothetical protein [Algiphilus acroporae]